MQGTTAVREKIQSLNSRIMALETIFGAPSDDEAEQIRRDELLRYAMPLPVKLEAEFFAASSRISKDNCGFYPRSRGCSDSLNMPKTMEKFPGSSRVYKKLSPTIWSVCELGIVLGTDRNGRWYNRWKSTAKGIN